MNKPSLVAALALVAACASPREAAPPPPTDTTVRAQLPVRVSWEEVSRTPTEAVVAAVVHRIGPLDTPFTVTIDVPRGARVVEGRTSFVLSPNTEALTTREKLVFSYEAPPTDDARLHVVADTGTMGFAFDVPYRFGRPAPAEPQVDTTGPALKKGDKSFGPSIPLN
ncbi:MAG: hypothetical protein ACOZQL_17785 [Myxococcota bacterium]